MGACASKASLHTEGPQGKHPKEPKKSKLFNIFKKRKGKLPTEEVTKNEAQTAVVTIAQNEAQAAVATIARDGAMPDASHLPEPNQANSFTKELPVAIRQEIPSRPVGRGLKNLGNSCFLNAAVQALLHCPDMMLLLANGAHVCPKEWCGNWCSFCSLRNVGLELFKSTSKALNPMHLYRGLKQLIPDMQWYHQEDSFDVIRGLLDTIAIRIDPQNAINLGLDGPPDLLDLLKKDMNENMADFTCGGCKAKGETYRQTYIYKQPDMLVIQLKRFHYVVKNGMHIKIFKKVNVPENLCLTDLLHEKIKKQNADYELSSVIVHQGSSVNYGHYYSYVKGLKNNAWFEMDDTNVSRSSWQEICNDTPYVLFYTKVKKSKAETAYRSPSLSPDLQVQATASQPLVPKPKAIEILPTDKTTTSSKKALLPFSQEAKPSAIITKELPCSQNTAISTSIQSPSILVDPACLIRKQQEAADEAYALQLALQFANGSYDDTTYDDDARKQLEAADALYAMQLQQEFDSALPEHLVSTSQVHGPIKNGLSSSGVRGSMEYIDDQDLNAIEREEDEEAKGEEDESARRAQIIEQDEHFARKLQAEFDKEMNGNPSSLQPLFNHQKDGQASDSFTLTPAPVFKFGSIAPTTISSPDLSTQYPAAAPTGKSGNIARPTPRTNKAGSGPRSPPPRHRNQPVSAPRRQSALPPTLQMSRSGYVPVIQPPQAQFVQTAGYEMAQRRPNAAASPPSRVSSANHTVEVEQQGYNYQKSAPDDYDYNPRLDCTLYLSCTKKSLKLTREGNFVVDIPVPEVLSVARFRNEQEFTPLRHTAVFGDPNEFVQRGYTLRQNQLGRETELFVTLYKEDDRLFCKASKAVDKNIANVCAKKGTSFWGPDAWENVFVCVISDGRPKIRPRILNVMGVMGAFQDGLMKTSVNGQEVSAHVFEYTTQILVDTESLQRRSSAQAVGPVQMNLCLNGRNAEQITAFGRALNPQNCALLDVGTMPTDASFWHLWHAVNQNPKDAGACAESYAEICSRGAKLLNPLVAAPNFEHKLPYILDKPLESVFGFNSVLPVGAFAAYRFKALQNGPDGTGPLEKYFFGETLHGAGDVMKTNMYLAEDRILCFELVTKWKERWVLQYVKAAKAETDVPDTVLKSALHRHRWLNGSFFASVYAIKWEDPHGRTVVLISDSVDARKYVLRGLSKRHTHRSLSHRDDMELSAYLRGATGVSNHLSKVLDWHVLGCIMQ
ncbi:chitin synthase [Synchytrium microbalum]|uniref:chitin synthase n=1 Tax=Synchytrium microbalum TaxID=1806994 RepID=A0A507CIH6_9FUNG|nr:chitin synthase [Synchytrium microbalum]TPX37505.1 chitin synthase [Synchytrium microbalum]